MELNLYVFQWPHHEPINMLDSYYEIFARTGVTPPCCPFCNTVGVLSLSTEINCPLGTTITIHNL